MRASLSAANSSQKLSFRWLMNVSVCLEHYMKLNTLVPHLINVMIKVFFSLVGYYFRGICGAGADSFFCCCYLFRNKVINVVNFTRPYFLCCSVSLDRIDIIFFVVRFCFPFNLILCSRRNVKTTAFRFLLTNNQ